MRAAAKQTMHNINHVVKENWVNASVKAMAGPKGARAFAGATSNLSRRAVAGGVEYKALFLGTMLTSSLLLALASAQETPPLLPPYNATYDMASSCAFRQNARTPAHADSQLRLPHSLRAGPS